MNYKKRNKIKYSKMKKMIKKLYFNFFGYLFLLNPIFIILCILLNKKNKYSY